MKMYGQINGKRSCNVVEYYSCDESRIWWSRMSAIESSGADVQVHTTGCSCVYKRDVNTVVSNKFVY